MTGPNLGRSEPAPGRGSSTSTSAISRSSPRRRGSVGGHGSGRPSVGGDGEQPGHAAGVALGDVFRAQSSVGVLLDYRGREHALMVLVDPSTRWRDQGLLGVFKDGPPRTCGTSWPRRWRASPTRSSQRSTRARRPACSALACPACPEQPDQIEDGADHLYLLVRRPLGTSRPPCRHARQPGLRRRAVRRHLVCDPRNGGCRSAACCIGGPPRSA